MTNRVYDTLKWVVQIVLPAVSALYLGLAQLWDFPEPERVVGTIALVTTFLGILIGLSKRTYENGDEKYDADILVGKTPAGLTRFSMELNRDPLVLAKKDSLLFKKVEVDWPEDLGDDVA